MAQRQVVLIEDDIEGGEATENVRFAYEGTEYEIDLNEANAAKMREAFTYYADHARRVGGTKRRSSERASSATGVDNRAVRAWAASNGISLSTRGRIPASVIEKYRASGN